MKLSDFGLETTAEAAARKGWSLRSVQHWVKSGLIRVVPVGRGRSATFLVQIKDVDRFEPPGRGNYVRKKPKKK